MIFAASWAISARIYRLFQRLAPSNIIIRRVHARDGIKSGPLVGLAGVTIYGLLLVAAASVVHHGGPGWINLIMLVAFWDAIKFAWLIPISLVRLLRIPIGPFWRRFRRRAGARLNRYTAIAYGVFGCRWRSCCGQPHELAPSPLR
jgi:hypothetical protein